MYRRSRLPLLVSLAFAVAACIGSGTPATDSGASPASSQGAAASPSPSASTAAASAPHTAEPTALPSETPTASTEPSPAESADAGAASVEGCTGSDDNRSFFGKAAADLDWPVYCAALPARWFVSAGSYSRAGPGKLEISYKGPNGATFALQQGAFCGDGTGCVPEGSDAGSAPFSDQAGTLVHFEDGRVAAVVDRGEQLSWLAIGDGLSDDAFRSITGALIRLD